MAAMFRVNRTRGRWPTRRSARPTLAPLKSSRVTAALSLDDVAPVTGIPLERVVATAQNRLVVTAVAVDEVVPGTAEEDAQDRFRPAACRCLRRLELSGPPLGSRPTTLTSSSPAPALTSIAVTALRPTLKSVVPSAPTSTWTVRRRAGVELQDELVARRVSGDRQRLRIQLDRVGGQRLVGSVAERGGEEDGGETAHRERSPSDPDWVIVAVSIGDLLLSDWCVRG